MRIERYLIAIFIGLVLGLLVNFSTEAASPSQWLGFGRTPTGSNIPIQVDSSGTMQTSQ